jgi:hypothetical protein
MKTILPVLFLALSLFSVSASSAQGFLTEYGDTVIVNLNGRQSVDVPNSIKSGTSNSVVVTWRVIDHYFAPGLSANGFCDNIECRDSLGTITGASYTTAAYGSYDIFYATFRDYGAAVGSVSWVKLYVTEGPAGTIGGTSRTLVFMVNKNTATGIANTRNNDNVSVFPNPARESVNVLFERESNVKTIAISNMIGKTMRVFKPTDNNSARLDLDNIPSGIYFIRLMNGDGHIVATRRFTRQ